MIKFLIKTILSVHDRSLVFGYAFFDGCRGWRRVLFLIVGGWIVLSKFSVGMNLDIRRMVGVGPIVVGAIQSMGEFCYWDAKSFGDTIIFAVLLFVNLIIGIITSQRLRNSRRMGQHGKKIMVIYILIIAWGTIIGGQWTYSIIIFFTNLFGNPKQSFDPFARNYVRFDILPGFLVQTIFLTICRYYYKGITGAIKINHLSKWQRSYINYLNVYYVVRIVAQMAGVLLVNINAENDSISLYSQINIWILVLDSVIMNIYLILSLKIYLKAIKYIQSMPVKEIYTLKIEYSFMIATSLMRVIIDIIFLVIPLFQASQNDQKPCVINDFTTHIMTSLFYNIFANLVNHILPIIWILKIYTYQILQPASEQYSQLDSPVVRSCLE